MTPNARTRQMYRDRGLMSEIVERHSPFPKPFGKKHDLLGIFDGVTFSQPIIGWQATSNAHLADRIAKVRSSEHYQTWLNLGHRIVCVGWAKKGPRGKRKLWAPTEVELTLETHPPLNCL